MYDVCVCPQAAQYADVSFNRLATVCERALQLARRGDSKAQQGSAITSSRLFVLSHVINT